MMLQRFLTSCRLQVFTWFRSVINAVKNRVLVNVPQLLRISHLRHDTTEWLHRPNEGRFRLHSWLISELRLCRVANPVC